jgi:aquaporin Z
MSMSLSRRVAAKFIGTFWLVFAGYGSAVLTASFPRLGIGFVGVTLAFGLTVLAMAYAIGHISGCHVNPAVSFGLWAGGRFPGNEVAPYTIAPVLGSIEAAAVLYFIASAHQASAFNPALLPTVTLRIRRAATPSPLRSYARS